jgi:hypothetical protein
MFAGIISGVPDMWRFEHSVQCQVDRGFAWGFWTEVRNWAAVDPAVEWVHLDGPFTAGTKGTTKPRGLDPTGWKLTEVQDRRGAAIEIAAPGAVLRFVWSFEDSTRGGTRITQRVTLEGERAEEYAEAIRGLEEGIPQGMERLAEAMTNAATSTA